MAAAKRKWQNYFLDPEIQSRTIVDVVLVVFVSNILTLVIGLLCYNAFKEKFFSDQVRITDPGSYSNGILLLCFVILITLAILSALSSVFMIVRMHAYVGPKYAVIKYIREKLLSGQYREPLILRSSDQFKDLQDAINLLRQDLEHRK